MASLATIPLAWGQPATGALTGRLIDPNGNVVTGLESASIELTNVDTRETVTAPVSRTSGDFSVDGLPPGTYDLRIPISCCLYRTYEQKGVAVGTGETLRLELPVQWGMNLGTIGDDPGFIGSDMRARAGDLSGPTPRTPDGKPDLTGVWSFFRPPRDPGPGGGSRGPRFSLKPWAAEIQRQLRELNVDGNAQAYCLPGSAIPSMLAFPQKLIQTPQVIVQLTEWLTPGFRQIFLDGRGHPEYWNPSWMGHSIGTWEGDTLVVETVGFNEITPGFGIHSDQLRVVERFRRPDYGRLEVQITAEDPEAWTAPFETTMEAALVPEEEILEFICSENNRPPADDRLPWRGRP